VTATSPNESHTFTDLQPTYTQIVVSFAASTTMRIRVTGRALRKQLWVYPPQ